MRIITGATRALITVAATGAAISVGVLSGAALAGAHVRVDADHAAPGSTSVLTFRLPGESENGALTTQLSVTLPNGGEPEHPASELTLSSTDAATPDAPQAAPAKDDSARWLAGGALTVAAVAVAAALLMRRRA